MEEHHHASPHVVGEGDAVVAPIKPRLQTLLVIAWLTVIQGVEEKEQQRRTLPNLDELEIEEEEDDDDDMPALE